MSLALPTSLAEYPEELLHPAPDAYRACYVCGQVRGKRTADDQWVTDQPLHPAGPTRRVRSKNGERVDELVDQPWRTRHTACEPTGSGVVRSLLALDVPDDVARRAITEVGMGTARTENATGTRPWAFLAPGDADLLRSVVQRELLVGVPRAHTSGRCGWCGRSWSASWSASGLTWPGGAPAALCQECTAARQQVRDPLDEQAVRRAAMRLAIGLIDAIGRTEHYGFRFAAEVISEQHRHNDEQRPWTYSPTGLAAVRKRAYRIEAGSIADEETRERQQRLNAARRARAEAEQLAATAEPAIDW